MVVERWRCTQGMTTEAPVVATTGGAVTAGMATDGSEPSEGRLDSWLPVLPTELPPSPDAPCTRRDCWRARAASTFLSAASAWETCARARAVDGVVLV